MIALEPATLDRLPPGVRRPGYDRAGLTPGIAHLSVGNFHRAHQAVYLDRILGRPGQDGWGILGIGLIDDERERAKAAALQAQDGLYTLTECPPQDAPEVRVVGSLLEYRHAPADTEAVLRRLADPAIRIVSMTVTEGGYNVDEQGRFRLEAPVVAADLRGDAPPRSAFGLVAHALRRRREAGAGPFTVLSCDNLRHNGAVARNAFLSFARALDPSLAGWMEERVSFPACMVDRITPATLPADAERLDAASGVADRAPVFAEDFIQWVLEDSFCAGRPALEEAGVQFTNDVSAFERVKLRMLNGSHNMLCFPGLLVGHRLVHLAMADPAVDALIRRFLVEDAAPLLSAPEGMALGPYGDTLLRRYRNPAIGDQLLRIAGDGASKLPVYIQDTLRGALAGGREHRRLAFLLACFTEYLGGRDDRGERFEVFEPHVSEADRGLAADPDLKAGLGMGVFAGWGLDGHDAFAADYARYRDSVRQRGAGETMRAVLAETEG